LCNIARIGRVDVKPHCLRIETVEGNHYQFAFDTDIELYTWLTDIRMAVNSFGKPELGTQASAKLHGELPGKTDDLTNEFK
jgi:hypothetical protein